MSVLSRFTRTLIAGAALAALGDAALAAPTPGSAWCGSHCDRVIVDWNQTTHQVIKAADGYADPMAASRVLAMVHLAMHDAVNAAAPRFRAHTFRPPAATPAPGTVDVAVAAAAAAHDVLAALYPAQKDLLRVALDGSLHDAGPGAAVEHGRRLGAAAAAAMLAARADDGSRADEAYRPGSRPGEWQFTPGFEFIAAPHWRAVRPFTLRKPEQFRVAPPPALGSAAYTAAFEEVKATGGQSAAARSAEQTQYAAYWYEFSDAGWNRIARVVARDRPQDLWQRARTFALLNAVMADAYIAGWDSKMHYDFWRPVTAIRQAAHDGNPATAADAGWTPMLPTPPIQDHPSTHSALGAAAAVVLAGAFGSDRIGFTMASPTAPAHAPSRRFESFSAAAAENADSRVRAGLHFRFATTEGLRLGERIGRQALAEHLTALR